MLFLPHLLSFQRNIPQSVILRWPADLCTCHAYSQCHITEFRLHVWRTRTAFSRSAFAEGLNLTVASSDIPFIAQPGESRPVTYYLKATFEPIAKFLPCEPTVSKNAGYSSEYPLVAFPSPSSINKAALSPTAQLFSSCSSQCPLQLPRVLNSSFSWGMQLLPMLAALVEYDCRMARSTKQFCGDLCRPYGMVSPFKWGSHSRRADRCKVSDSRSLKFTPLCSKRPATMRKQFLGHSQLSVISYQIHQWSKGHSFKEKRIQLL